MNLKLEKLYMERRKMISNPRTGKTEKLIYTSHLRESHVYVAFKGIFMNWSEVSIIIIIVATIE